MTDTREVHTPKPGALALAYVSKPTFDGNLADLKRPALADLHALISERDRLHEAVARGMAGQREWVIERDALAAQVATLREALAASDYWLASWLNGDALEARIFSEDGENLIQRAHRNAVEAMGSSEHLSGKAALSATKSAETHRAEADAK